MASLATAYTEGRIYENVIDSGPVPSTYPLHLKIAVLRSTANLIVYTKYGDTSCGAGCLSCSWEMRGRQEADRPSPLSATVFVPLRGEEGGERANLGMTAALKARFQSDGVFRKP